jgi:hypothetical protein
MESNLKNKLSSNTVIVFYFDGTIADTFDAVVKIFEEIGKRSALLPNQKHPLCWGVLIFCFILIR